MSEAAAKFTSVEKRLGGKLILHDVGFEVREGEIVGLLGPNGSGKTTVMKVLCGMLSPDKGTVTRSPRFRALIEEPCFYPSLSGYENLRYFASVAGRKTVDDTIERLNLQKYIGRKVKKYSLGIRQKLGIACALLSAPDLLILDEPTNGLDPFAIVQIRTLLCELARERGTAILVSSHILGEMQKLCQRALLLKDGRIITQQKITEGIDLEELYVSCFREET